MFYIIQVIQHTIQLFVSELSKQAKNTLSGDYTFVSDFPRSYLFPWLYSFTKLCTLDSLTTDLILTNNFFVRQPHWINT